MALRCPRPASKVSAAPCLTRVLEGDVDQRDPFLTPEEQAANAQLFPCCLRAGSARLVLDL